MRSTTGHVAIIRTRHRKTLDVAYADDGAASNLTPARRTPILTSAAITVNRHRRRTDKNPGLQDAPDDYPLSKCNEHDVNAVGGHAVLGPDTDCKTRHKKRRWSVRVPTCVYRH